MVSHCQRPGSWRQGRNRAELCQLAAYKETPKIPLLVTQTQGDERKCTFMAEPVKRKERTMPLNTMSILQQVLLHPVACTPSVYNYIFWFAAYFTTIMYGAPMNTKPRHQPRLLPVQCTCISTGKKQGSLANLYSTITYYLKSFLQVVQLLL